MATEPVTDFKFAIEGTAASVPETEASTTRLIGITTDDEAVTLRVNSDYVDALTSDPFSFGVSTPNIVRWTQSIFPSEYEAEADRDITPAQRATRLQAIFTKGATQGKEVVIPPASENYVIDSPIYWPRTPLTVHLDGILENAAINTSNDAGCVFKMGSTHPAQWGGYEWFTCGSPSAGADQVTLDSGDNRTDGLAAIAVGDQVLVRSAKYALGGGVNPLRMRPIYALLANVVAVDADTGLITLDRAFDEAPQGGALIANAYQPTLLDLRGQGTFVANKPRLMGAGGVISPRDWLGRSGMLDAHIDLRTLQGENCFAGNLFSSTVFNVDRIRIIDNGTSNKLADIAGMSHDSVFTFNRMDFEGVGVDVSMVVVNESARNVRVKGGLIFAPNYNVGNVINFNTCRRSTVEIERIYAPEAIAPIVALTNAATTVSGDLAQPLLHDNILRLGRVDATAPGRFILVDGPENKRNRIESAQFFGTPQTGYAIEVDGDAENTFIGAQVRCENGALRVSTGAVNVIARGASFPGGVSFQSGTMADHSISGIRSTISKLFRAGREQINVSTNSSTTTVGDVVHTMTVAPGGLTTGHVIEFEYMGNVPALSTNDEKRFRLRDQAGNTYFDLTLAAADVGTVHIKGTLFIQSGAIIRGMIERMGVAVLPTRPAFTGQDFATNGLTLNMERWVANASDVIATDFCSFVPRWHGYDM